jgi:hypothetical protein
MTKELNDIFVLTGQEEDRDPYGWEGMPEFVQKENEAYDEITVRFRNQEDLDEFCQLIDHLNLALPKKRRKSCWFPKHDRMANTLNRWFDEDELGGDDKEPLDNA